jgi:hypothetical protein
MIEKNRQAVGNGHRKDMFWTVGYKSVALGYNPSRPLNRWKGRGVDKLRMDLL